MISSMLNWRSPRASSTDPWSAMAATAHTRSRSIEAWTTPDSSTVFKASVTAVTRIVAGPAPGGIGCSRTTPLLSKTTQSSTSPCVSRTVEIMGGKVLSPAMTTRAMIVVGGGSSSRFGSDKLFVELAGRPLITHAVESVRPHVDTCVVVCRPDQIGEVTALGLDVVVTVGGDTRTESERAGLAAVDPAAELIGIHDAARPLVSAGMVELLFETAARHGGAVPVVGVDQVLIWRDSVEPVMEARGAQTPQVFAGPELLKAFTIAAETGYSGHDTADVVQRFGSVTIQAVPGDPHNIKVTYPEDIELVKDQLSGPSRR